MGQGTRRTLRAPRRLRRPSAGRAFAHGQRLVKALRLVLEAYVLFDRDASGTIDRVEVLSMVDESAGRLRGVGRGRQRAALARAVDGAGLGTAMGRSRSRSSCTRSCRCAQWGKGSLCVHAGARSGV